MSSHLLLPSHEEVKKKEEIREKKKREGIELAFKIISALGVLAGIFYGGYKLFPEKPVVEPPYTTFEIPATVMKERVPFQAATDVVLRQFELFGIESAFVKHSDQAIGSHGNSVPSYSLDPYYSKTTTSTSFPTVRVPSPIFTVTIENPRDRDLVVSRIIYRVNQIGEVAGGAYGPLSPNAKYRTPIEWVVADQVVDLVPAFRIAAKSTGSFLLEIASRNPGVGLTWLMQVLFVVDGDFTGVSTGEFELIMNKAQ